MTLFSKTSRLKLHHELDTSNYRFVSWFPDVALHLLSLKYPDLQFNDFEGVLTLVLFDNELNTIFLNDNYFSFQMSDNFGNSKTFIIVFANTKIHGCLLSNIDKIVPTFNKLVLMNKLSRFNWSFLLNVDCLGG